MILDYALAAYLVLSAGYSLAMVGRPRDTTTSGGCLISLAIYSLLVYALLR